MYGGRELSLEIFPTLFLFLFYFLFFFSNLKNVRGRRLPLDRSLSTSFQATIKIHHLIFSFSYWKEDIQLEAD